MRKTSRIVGWGLTGPVLAALPLALATPSPADTLAEGAVVNVRNFAEHRSASFEGHTLGDLMTVALTRQVVDFGLKITLKKSQGELKPDPKYWELTQRYKDGVTFDPTTRLVSGWVVGMPFPDLSIDDSHVADKIIWNIFYGRLYNDSYTPRAAFVFIDAGSGIERVQEWTNILVYTKGRWAYPEGSNRYQAEDGTRFDIIRKQLLFARYPQDIKGIGTYQVQYDNPRLPDVWAYIRTVRRVRRLSGGAWVDPIGGTDWIADDFEGFNAHPSWYKDFKLLGRRHILAMADTDWGQWNPNGATYAEQFTTLDLSTPPYWNLKQKWEPRDVWVVEATPPEYHPYSKRVIHVDAKLPIIYRYEMWDKKGDLWRTGTNGVKAVTGQDGSRIVQSNAIVGHDLQRLHGTLVFIDENYVFHTGRPPEEVSLSVLEAAGR